MTAGGATGNGGKSRPQRSSPRSLSRGSSGNSPKESLLATATNGAAKEAEEEGKEPEDEVPAAGEEEEKEKAEEEEEQKRLLDETTTWLQCEANSCGKWRRVKKTDVPDGEWFCKDNKDPLRNKCPAPQELPDEEIDRLMELETDVQYLSCSSRPPLEECSEKQFSSDLMSFHDFRGEPGMARQLKENRIMCNGSPMDFFGLYKAVAELGGLEVNQAYDEVGRWQGRINFSGMVFRKMKNFTQNNKATSIGNQLLSNYKKFLLPYERVFGQRDITYRPAPMEKKVPSKAAAGPNGVAVGGGVGGGGASRKSGRRPMAKPDPYDFLIGIAATAAPAKDPEGDHQPNQQQQQGAQQQPHEAAEALARKRFRQGTANVAVASQHQDCANDVAAIRKELDRASAFSWVSLSQHFPDPEANDAPWTPSSRKPPPPGELLLVQDRYVPSRLWPVVVASAADLPGVVAGGGTCSGPDGTSTSGKALDVLTTHEEAKKHLEKSKGKPSSSSGGPSRPALDGSSPAVFPALLLGTSTLGWVSASRCRIYSQAESQASAADWMPRQLLELRCGGGRAAAGGGGGAARGGGGGDPDAWMRRNVLAGAVKEAAAMHHNLHKRSHARALVQAASTQVSAARMLALEADLPSCAFWCGSSALWQSFRVAVQQASNTGSLIPQVLLMAHQLTPAVLKSQQASKAMWGRLQDLLMVGPPGAQPSLVPSPDTAGSHPGGATPSCRAMDDAVASIEDSINWEAAAAMWERRAAPPVEAAVVSAGGGPQNDNKDVVVRVSARRAEALKKQANAGVTKAPPPKAAPAPAPEAKQPPSKTSQQSSSVKAAPKAPPPKPTSSPPAASTRSLPTHKETTMAKKPSATSPTRPRTAPERLPSASTRTWGCSAKRSALVSKPANGVGTATTNGRRERKRARSS